MVNTSSDLITLKVIAHQSNEGLHLTPRFARRR
jgi:hypothetical protein